MKVTAIFAAGVFSAASAQGAVTINWGNAPSGLVVNYDSAGMPLTDSAFSFEFGTFEFGTPQGTPDVWRDQWTVLDTPEEGYNQSLQTFMSTWISEDNSLAGRQASIWIHNSDFTATEATEWGIYTADDWIIPDMGDQRDTPLEFRITDLPQNDELFPADQRIYGGLFENPGPGEFSATPDGAIIQTFTFVPEPSSAVLALFAGGMALLRRKR